MLWKCFFGLPNQPLWLEPILQPRETELWLEQLLFSRVMQLYPEGVYFFKKSAALGKQSASGEHMSTYR